MKILKNVFSICISILYLTGLSNAQTGFTDTSTLLAYPSLKSGVAIGVADMNADGLDDIVRLSGASNLQIEYQLPTGGFSGYIHGDVGTGSEWSMCIADVDENGFNDILAGGAYNAVKILKANGTGTEYSTANLPIPPAIFAQGTNFNDINNDGSVDVFACHDDGVSAPYRNMGTGNFVYDLTLINAVSTIPSDNSGNYGSIWTDYDMDGDIDLYISKCRQGVTDSLDGRRVNLLFQNDGSNNFTEVADSANLRPLQQSWATAFGDLDNDGDMDAFIINHFAPCNLMQNNGDGTFTDVTLASGAYPAIIGIGFGIQVLFEDFDNDGLLDILVTATSGSGNHKLLRNLGGMTFVDSTASLPTSDRMHSAAAGDLNHDGFVDLITTYGSSFNTPSGSKPDKLFLNNGNSNHFINFRLIGDESNLNAIGAKINIKGSFGSQWREVRSGESYGIMNSLGQNFGLGSATIVDSIFVHWPSGTLDTFTAINADQFLHIIEGGCIYNGGPGKHIVVNTDDSGDGSLRALLNRVCPLDTVTFDNALFNSTITLTGPEIELSDTLYIEGLGSNFLTVNGGGNSRIFSMNSASDVTISGLKLTNASFSPFGGAFYNLGRVRLSDVRFDFNESGDELAPFTNDGIVYIRSGTVVVKK